MKKFLIGLVTGLVLAGLFAVVAVILAVAALSTAGHKPAIPENSTLVFNLRGAVPEAPPMRVPIPILEAQTPPTVREIWQMLRDAASDQRISAVIFMPRNVGVGWGKLQEIRDSLLQFKKSGKPLVAYLKRPGTREYYLATAADHIYMSREDMLDVKGLRAESVFLRGTLNKLGVQVEIEHAGKYKDAGDMFVRESMSPETREVLNTILDELYAHLLTMFSKARGQTVEQIRTTLDDGPFLAVKARQAGLVDDLIYEDEMFERLRTRLGQDKLRKTSYRSYIESSSAADGSSGKNRVALLVASGTIVSGSGGGAFEDEGLIRSGSFIRLLRKVSEDQSIRAVILRIDSPGGDAIASDEILREVRLLSGKKPMVVSMSDVAASGGYYIAMSGDPVVAYPNTFTGSIGVIYGKLNLRGLYDKLGIRKQYLTRGRFADIDSDYRPLSGPARAKLREGINATYQSFLARVAEGRKRPVDQVQPLAQGRVWLGVQARRNGLVDELGGLDRAIALVKQRAGIPEQETVSLVSYPPQRNLLDYLLEKNDESLVDAGLREMSAGFDLRVLKEGGVLRLMPYTIDVR